MNTPKTDKEFILCAAIHVDDSIIYDDVSYPTNITTGYVFLGYRHSTIKGVNGLMLYYNAHNIVAKVTQGFLTSKNRFLDRNEAAQVAIKADQISVQTMSVWSRLGVCKLFSEDLY